MLESNFEFGLDKFGVFHFWLTSSGFRSPSLAEFKII